MDTLPELEIFRVGDLTDSQGTKRTFTAEDLDKIASAYSADNPAPVVVGHPKDDTPAYGWIDSLRVAGGKLLAKVGKASDTFVSAVKEGAYKRISVALFGPDHGSNPNPGQFSLRHVGFLGGAAPAVPGLKPVEFANTDPDKIVTFEVEQTAADKTVPVNFVTHEEPKMADPNDKKTDDGTDKDAEIEALKAENAKFKAAEEARAKADAEAQTKADAEFVAAKIKDGVLLPAHKDRAIAFLAASGDTEITFSADGKEQTETARDFFKAMTDEASPWLKFEAMSPTGERGDGQPRTPAEFSAAADQMVEEAKKAGKHLTKEAALEALEQKGAE